MCHRLFILSAALSCGFAICAPGGAIGAAGGTPIGMPEPVVPVPSVSSMQHVAQAQQPAARTDAATRDAAARLAGAFTLTSADGERRCAVTLRGEAGGAGFAVGIDRAACAPIAFASQVAAWLPDPSGAIRLLGAEGRTLAEFTEATGGSYEALREGDGVYFLASPSAAAEAVVSLEDMGGDWVLTRGAEVPACRWTFTEESTGEGRHAVRVAAGCDEAMARFAPVSWIIEGGNVLVHGADGGSPIRFARQEDGIWARIPERGRPLLMMRPQHD